MNSDWISPVRIKGFDRLDLAKLFAEFGLVKGAEIGVADGRHSLQLCQTIPNLQLFCVDPWVRYSDNPRAHSQSHQDICFRQATESLKPYNAEIIRDMSMAAVLDFPPESLDFVYIDGHHSFDYVMQDLIEWGKRVRPGGIIAGHDYYHFRWAGVVTAVNAYTKAHNVNEWFIDDDRREPSFFWVKG